MYNQLVTQVHLTHTCTGFLCLFFFSFFPPSRRFSSQPALPVYSIVFLMSASSFLRFAYQLFAAPLSLHGSEFYHWLVSHTTEKNTNKSVRVTSVPSQDGLTETDGLTQAVSCPVFCFFLLYVCVHRSSISPPLLTQVRGQSISQTENITPGASVQVCCYKKSCSLVFSPEDSLKEVGWMRGGMLPVSTRVGDFPQHVLGDFNQQD